MSTECLETIFDVMVEFLQTLQNHNQCNAGGDDGDGDGVGMTSDDSFARAVCSCIASFPFANFKVFFEDRTFQRKLNSIVELAVAILSSEHAHKVLELQPSPSPSPSPSLSPSPSPSPSPPSLGLYHALFTSAGVSSRHSMWTNSSCNVFTGIVYC